MTSRGSASERISPTALAFTSAPAPLRIDSCGPQIWRLRFGSPDDDAGAISDDASAPGESDDALADGDDSGL